jgi:hypothetical protein
MAKKSVEESSKDIAKRWTPTLVRSGWTPISTFFIDNYHRLEPTLTSLEAMLVVHLMRHKWDERHPHPSFATLARRMGVTATATRNHARSLEKKRYLNRILTQGESNQFDLTPLFYALERLYLADDEAKHANSPKPGAKTGGDDGTLHVDSIISQTIAIAEVVPTRSLVDQEEFNSLLK